MAKTLLELQGPPHLGVAECKANLSGYVANVERTGEPIVIMRYGKPAAMLVPVPRDHRDAGKARGILSDCADPAKTSREKGAFERAMVAKHASR